ncbi:MAG: hypothetical protein ACK4ON_14795, partial [Bacteroidia bacterium]
PLHKFYGGENAFTLEQYLAAMNNAGLIDVNYYSYYDSPINYLPITTASINRKEVARQELIENSLRAKLGRLYRIAWLKRIYARWVERKLGPVLNEKIVPGRPYTFIGIKP